MGGAVHPVVQATPRSPTNTPRPPHTSPGVSGTAGPKAGLLATPRLGNMAAVYVGHLEGVLGVERCPAHGPAGCEGSQPNGDASAHEDEGP